MKKRKIILISLLLSSLTLVCLLSAALIISCYDSPAAAVPESTGLVSVPAESPTPEPVPTPTPTPEPVFEEYDITLMALGDNLMHMGIVRTGEKQDGSRDYSVLYKGISKYP